MKQYQASQFVHALRSYVSELECEYPDLTDQQLKALLIDGAPRLYDIVKLGGEPRPAVTICLQEQLTAKLIPPWA